VFADGRAFPSTPVILIAAVSVPLLATGAVVWLRIRRRPKDKEKHRRMMVNLHGRLGDANITEVEDNVIFYSYSVGGVMYTASQDISQLGEFLRCEPERLTGRVASLKYSPRNPANSIILCEEWSGLRIDQPSYKRKPA